MTGQDRIRFIPRKFDGPKGAEANILCPTTLFPHSDEANLADFRTFLQSPRNTFLNYATSRRESLKPPIAQRLVEQKQYNSIPVHSIGTPSVPDGVALEWPDKLWYLLLPHHPPTETDDHWSSPLVDGVVV